MKHKVIKKEVLYDIARAAVKLENHYTDTTHIGSAEWDGERERLIGKLLGAVRFACGWPAKMEEDNNE